MDDVEYRQLIRTYGEATLVEVIQQLDQEKYPQRLLLLEAELRARQEGTAELFVPEPELFAKDPGYYAGFLPRAVATAIDVTLIYLPLSYLFDWAMVTEGGLQYLLIYPLAFPLYLILSQLISGQTIGRWLMGLCVVDKTGNKASVGQILLRHLPDLLLGLGMVAALIVFISSATVLPEGSTRVSAFHFRVPLWDLLDDIWDVWIWSELVLLTLDERRRCLHEILSGSYVIHHQRRGDIPPSPEGDRSYADWLTGMLSR